MQTSPVLSRQASSSAILSLAALASLLAGCATVEQLRRHPLSIGPERGADVGIAATEPGADASGSNVRVNQDAGGRDQAETFMVVSPTDPLNLVGVAMDYRNGVSRAGFYWSANGGQTWTDGAGSYGDGSPARPNLRDPLDESLQNCP